MVLRTVLEVIRSESSRRSLTETPAPVAGVDRPRESQVDMRFTVEETLLGSQTHEATTALPTSRCWPLRTKPCTQPAPQSGEQVAPPAKKSPPARTTRPEARELATNLPRRLPVDQVSAKCVEDRVGRVPPPRMEEIWQDADGSCAVAAAKASHSKRDGAARIPDAHDFADV